ncbi:MAG: PP2C family protein-serine/threonine phosphatase [Microcoleaceae cyanobacterium]
MSQISTNQQQESSELSGLQKFINPINSRLKSKLSRRIVLYIFTSIIVIEGIILIPSVKRREQELLGQIKQMSSGKVAWILITYPNASGKELVNRLSELMQHNALILGGAVYSSNGQKIGIFGESPELSFDEISNSEKPLVASQNGSRYDDLVWSGKDMKTDYSIILRHDASNVTPKLLAYIARIIGLVIIISLFITITVWLFLEPIVMNPIFLLRCDLIKAGEAISQDKSPPEFDSVSLHRKDELGEVINTFELMFIKINEAIGERKKAEAALQESLEKVAAYSQALNSELEKGHEMQKNFLPAELLEKTGWEIAAFFQPARQVAGDFYDIFELSNDTVGLVIADVCDKGVGAALFMSLFRSLIRIFSGQHSFQEKNQDIESAGVDKFSLDKHLASEDCFNALKAVCLTNNYIAKHHGDVGMFATLFFGVLDINNGTLTYINGGHEPLFIIDALGGIKQELNSTGPAVGMLPDMNFKIEQTNLEPGEILLGYTDGVPEARNSQGEFFTDRKLRLLVEKKAASAEALLEEISSSVLAHTGAANQFDDITLLAVQRQN